MNTVVVTPRTSGRKTKRETVVLFVISRIGKKRFTSSECSSACKITPQEAATILGTMRKLKHHERENTWEPEADFDAKCGY